MGTITCEFCHGGMKVSKMWSPLVFEEIIRRVVLKLVGAMEDQSFCLPHRYYIIHDPPPHAGWRART